MDRRRDYRINSEQYLSMNNINSDREELYKRMHLKSLREKERIRQKRRQKRLNRVSSILGILILILVIMTILTIFFKTSEIIVKGNDRIEKEKIVDIVTQNGKVGDINLNNTLFTYIVYKLGLDEKPKYIDDIDVKIKKIDTIEVIVKEKEILGYIEKNNKYYVIDKEGIIIDIYEVLPEDMIKIEGLKINSYKKYSNIKSKNSNTFEYVKIISEYSKREGLETSIIDINNLNDIKLNIGNKVVLLGGSQLLELKLSKIQEMIKKLGDVSGELHLEYYSEDNDIVTFNNYS